MLRKFFSYYKPYKGLFILDFSCAVVAGLLELGFPLIVNQFIDKLLPGQNWTLILWACFGLLAVYMLNAGLQYVVTYWGHMLGVNIETDMRQKLFDHIQKLSFRFFDNNKTGHLISRLTNDLMEIGEIAHHNLRFIYRRNDFSWGILIYDDDQLEVSVINVLRHSIPIMVSAVLQ